nr:myosin-H heavy chain-like protein [Ipomoea batatas]
MGGPLNRKSWSLILFLKLSVMRKLSETITQVVLVSLWKFSSIRGEGFLELPSELTCWKGLGFVKCLIPREIIIVSICSVLHQLRMFKGTNLGIQGHFII